MNSIIGKECHSCKQPINSRGYILGMSAQYGYQHWTNLKARWYMPLDMCPESKLMRTINSLVTKIISRGK